MLDGGTFCKWMTTNPDSILNYNNVIPTGGDDYNEKCNINAQQIYNKGVCVSNDGQNEILNSSTSGTYELYNNENDCIQNSGTWKRLNYQGRDIQTKELISQACCINTPTTYPEYREKYSVSCEDSRRQPICIYNLENLNLH